MSTDGVHYVGDTPKITLIVGDITGQTAVIYKIQAPDGETTFEIDPATVEDEGTGEVWARALASEDWEEPGIYRIHAYVSMPGSLFFHSRLYEHEVTALYEK